MLKNADVLGAPRSPARSSDEGEFAFVATSLRSAPLPERERIN